MLEAHRAREAEKHYQAALAAWQEQCDGLAQLIDLAGNDKWDQPDGVVLQPGEDVVLTVSGTGLIEDRRGAGHWVGGSQGLSIPVGSLGGRSVRYRVGATRGHYVQAPPTPAAIDTGDLHITTRRVLFLGAKQTRECHFDKLVGFSHDDAAGETTFAVSNRQKATVVHYGPKLADVVDFRLDLALARFHGTTNQLVATLRKQLDELDTERPVPPPAQGAPDADQPPTPAAGIVPGPTPGPTPGATPVVPPVLPVPTTPAAPPPTPPPAPAAQPPTPTPTPTPPPAAPATSPPAAGTPAQASSAGIATGPPAGPPSAPPGFVIMSPDGLAWWDGNNWIPVAHATPWWAIRSDDGRWWWDGRAWRPVV